MKKYYLKDGNRETGPFMLDDLKYQRIRPSTLVKINDGEWQLISEVDDLKFLLKLRKDNTYSNATEKQTVSKNTPQENAPNKRVLIVAAVGFIIAALGAAMALFFGAR